MSGEENLETHNITMTRREAVSKWLEEEVVGPRAKKDMDHSGPKQEQGVGAPGRPARVT